MPDPLHVACLSGGDTRGAFQAGVLDGLNRSGVRFHAFVGTSTGALNGGYLSQVDDRLEEQARQIERLRDVWFSLRDRPDIIDDSWLKALFRILRRRPSLAGSERLVALLERHIVGPPKVPVWLSTVSLDTGRQIFLRPRSREELRTAILASASTPVVMEPVSAVGLVDGGVREISPLGSALRHARELREPNQPVRIYLIQGFPMGGVERDPTGTDWRRVPLWRIGLRTLQIANHETMRNDEEHAMRINDLVGIFEDHPELDRPAWLRERIHAEIVRVECTAPDAPYGMFEVEPALIRRAWERGVERGLAVASGAG